MTSHTVPLHARRLFQVAGKLTADAVPKLADASSVDLLEVLLRGGVPPPGPVDGSKQLRRAAFLSTRGEAARSAYAVGEVSRIRPATPYGQSLSDLRPRLIRHLNHNSRWLVRDPRRARLLREAGAHSLIVLPLTVRGVVLGLFVLYRRHESSPFNENDLREAARLADRAAQCLETVRRQIDEDALARLLRRSVLPERLPRLSALEAAHGHVPAEASAGQWFDVLPLSSARVALVVANAGGKGVDAAIGMTRLRAVITTLSALDLRPDELLTHLDSTVTRLERQRPASCQGTRDRDHAGISCLYVVYDPVTGRCVAARAGDPTMMVAHPNGDVTAPRLASHSPLGVGDQPFENTEFEAPPGSTMLLNGGRSPTPAPPAAPTAERFREALATSGPDVSRLLDHVLRGLRPDREPAVLLARTRALESTDVAALTLPPDPAAVSSARDWTGRQLATWTLDDLADSTTLVISELVTNAIRYSDGPIGLRLIKDDHTLICEVSDTSCSGPHRRRPKATEEGGRGLSIVSQLTRNQGTRYTTSGKIIWTEQPLPA
ncbi:MULTISPECIES: SpoIIE family protein phosphatase [unclassified Streptomyces]|uniref:ATP-binding SpoIIE family protein phosphatase n=1 Tax=unclassified Streptomyces TaxID=2593676 RepID=UPI00342C3039